MNPVMIPDILFALALLASLIFGAKRGLFKSLMALLVVFAALVGASVAAAQLTAPLTDAVMPKVEQKVNDYLAVPENVNKDSIFHAIVSSDSHAESLFSGWFDRLERFGAGTSFLERVQDSTVTAAKTAARVLVENIVHTVLFLVLFIVLLLVLKLLTKALDHVFDLPGLRTLNGVGGALLGLIECALLLFLICSLSPRLGIAYFTEHSEGTYLVSFFVNNTPRSLVSALISH